MIEIKQLEETPDKFPRAVPCWKPADASSPNVKAFLWCPNGHCACLTSETHTVAEDGTVNPSCVCPVQGCGFHDYVKLIGWPGVHKTG